jgi:hypothetical protein
VSCFGTSCQVSALMLVPMIRDGVAEAGENEERGRGAKTAPLRFCDRGVPAT